ncbi:hypothetical protein BHE74_00023149 [Ensete ventricosum]|nr:hypothetical protein BHE74_00023149 [Ensete ventricosum]
MYLEYVVRPSLEQSEQRDAQDEQVRGVEKGTNHAAFPLRIWFVYNPPRGINVLVVF